MVKNADKLYYPIQESIRSALPIVDEYVVALGDSDVGDETEDLIAAINSPKIKVIRTTWDIDQYPNGTENAHQTDIAKEACSGDWLLYLQADEVLHEHDHASILRACERHLDDTAIEGLLFDYHHFWGDYGHTMVAHGWYQQEIRIIRNNSDIHSWESAQSFRRIPDFDGRDYRQQDGTHKLTVARAEAHIYHYGWVRPPRLMQRKRKALDTIHKGKQRVADMYSGQDAIFDYGPLSLARVYDGSHPEVMQHRISQHDWAHLLREKGPMASNRHLFKHERLKYRVITWIEQHLCGGRQLGAFRNYIQRR